MKHICIPIIIACLCSACLEKIGFKINESPVQRLVVEGGLTTEFKPHQVILGLSGKVIGENKYTPATGAAVTVTDGRSTYVLAESGPLPGHYISDSLAAVVGKTYALTILYEGQRYEARAAAVQAGSFEPVAYMPAPEGSIFGRGFYEIVLPGNFGASHAYIYQFIYDIPDDWKDNFPYPIPPVLAGNDNYEPRDTAYLVHQGLETAALLEYSESVIGGLPVGTDIYEKRYFTSEEHYDFLRSVLMETDWRGVNIMQTIPANVPTNISNGAYGFFYVMDVYEVHSTVSE